MGKTSGANALKESTSEPLPTNAVPLTGVSLCKTENTKPEKVVKYWVKLDLQFKEEHGEKDVPQTPFSLTKGDAEIRRGGLADGKAEVSDLEFGLYDISFPEIDATEWGPA